MNIYQKDHTQIPVVFTFIKEHRNDEAMLHFRKHPDEINLKGWMSDTPLHLASSSGNLEMVQFLVKNGAEVNARRTGVYKTPLCWAKTYDVAKFLLSCGATTSDDELYYATRTDNVEVVDLLLTSGASIDSDNPQYVECNSIDCIKVYLKHGITIDQSDERGNTILHSLAWKNNPEVFDFAFQNGCPWAKDTSLRTPYHLARHGARKRILEHMGQHYAELVLPNISVINHDDYKFETICYFTPCPKNKDIYFALTINSKLIRYQLTDGELVIEKTAQANSSVVRNFEFDRDGNLLLPCSENKLLLIDPQTFQPLKTIVITENLDLDQIKYLPQRNIFLCSTENWEIVLLTHDFQLIEIISADDGTISPLVSSDENLIAFRSYDQELYYNLYRIDKSNKISFIHTFFKAWGNSSNGFAFNGNDFVVSFPGELEYYTLENDQPVKKWEISLKPYKSEYGHSSLCIPEPGKLIIGRGKKLLFVNIKQQKIIRETELDLIAEIRTIRFGEKRNNLFIITPAEIKIIALPDN